MKESEITLEEAKRLEVQNKALRERVKELEQLLKWKGSRPGDRVEFKSPPSPW